MYVQSYSSLIWNKIVSWRLREYGLKPVVGDLVKKGGRGREGWGGDREKAVEYVSEENCSQYTIDDVVLPLPGYDILYPMNKGMMGLCSRQTVYLDMQPLHYSWRAIPQAFEGRQPHSWPLEA